MQLQYTHSTHIVYPISVLTLTQKEKEKEKKGDKYRPTESCRVVVHMKNESSAAEIKYLAEIISGTRRTTKGKKKKKKKKETNSRESGIVIAFCFVYFCRFPQKCVMKRPLRPCYSIQSGNLQPVKRGNKPREKKGGGAARPTMEHEKDRNLVVFLIFPNGVITSLSGRHQTLNNNFSVPMGVQVLFSRLGSFRFSFSPFV